MSAKSTKAEPNYQVPNLDRALTIMELLSHHPDGLSLSEIVEKLELPKNSVFRITTTLMTRGYVDRDERTKKMRLGRKLMALGCSTLAERSLVEKSIDVMRDLRDLTQETVLVGTLYGAEGVVLEQCPGLHPFKFLVDVGLRFALHTAAPGKAILAHLPEAEAEKILKQMKLVRCTANTITSVKAFRQELVKVRELGYGVDHAEDVEGQHCVAAPVFNEHGYPIASLWITAPSARVPASSFEEVGAQIIEHAQKVSQRFGYVGRESLKIDGRVA